ncbi:MAG: CPBP family intramembrane metalloprotease [Bacteroidales bacterium]|nr:CPBP family intramembrane metalloprotease [Bacteroidales bacterium]MCM1415652.1 CPBP family intramembrane metalloprotease [bacterium]MCM1422972.1 CPBP family intramembrane metalloprotease [bacterium]
MNERSSLKKAWDVLFPYLLYYLAYNAAYLIMAFACQVTVQRFGGAYGQFMTDHAADVAGVAGGLCMLIGILPLVPMLQKELQERGKATPFAAPGTAMTTQYSPKGRHKGSMSVLTVVLALTASLGLNAFLTLIGFADSSQSYRQVADRQYGVAFAAGLLLYGVISPLAEEVVFRGVIYNRMRRLYTPAIGIAASGLLFGIFHGNPVQGVYGACLGILMAYLYERSGRFLTPVLFHAVANLAVYTTARMGAVQEVLFTPAGCAVLLAVSAGCVFAERGGIFQKKER